jgi:hypothetical protein
MNSKFQNQSVIGLFYESVKKGFRFRVGEKN